MVFNLNENPLQIIAFMDFCIKHDSDIFITA